MKEVKKFMTMAELEASQTRSVFVVNTSPRQLRSEIIFAVERQNGMQEDIVRIPLTWIPIDITAAVPKEALLASTRFRQTHQKGLIQVVTPEYAAVLMSQEGADIEKERVEQFFRARIASIQTEAVNEDSDFEERRNPVRDRINARKEKEDKELTALHAAQSGFEARVARMVGQSSIQVISSLRNEGELTMAELRFANEKLGKDVKVSEWLRAKARALKAAKTRATAEA